MMMKRILGIAVALAVPALLAAQTPIPANERVSETATSKLIPSEHPSDMAQQKVAAAMARRATRVRGQAVGLDNRPVTPAMPGADRAIPNPGSGPATRAVPPNPATPASPSQRPDNPGAGHGRRP